jgi:hypothetical protein
MDRVHNQESSSSTFDEGYWLKRARLTYDKAATAKSPDLQKRLQRVAFEYERLAGFVMHDASRPAPQKTRPRPDCLSKKLDVSRKS